jgi:hypothetical protein
VWNDSFLYEVKDLATLHNHIKFTVMDEDVKFNDTYGSETFKFGLLYNNGQGYMGKIPVFDKNGQWNGEINVRTTFEAKVIDS